MIKNSRGIAVILPIILVLLILGVVGYIVYNNIQQNSKYPIKYVPNTKEATPVSTTSGEKEKTRNKVSIEFDQERYTSENLGISFIYVPTHSIITNYVKEIGNKIYVYNNLNDLDINDDYGQYVEVFDKDPSLTLKEVVELKFLSGYSKEDCIAIEKDVRDRSENYQQVVIEVPREFYTLGEYLAERDDCPLPYTATGGYMYFLMDENYPNRYVYISATMDPTMADLSDLEDLITWDETITFIDK